MMNLIASANGYLGFRTQYVSPSSRITGDDLDHMHTFSLRRKQRVMEAIMSRVPDKASVAMGHNHYEKTILRLRKHGFQLIDFQPQEFVLTSVWCRHTRSMFSMPHLEVSMLLWVVEEEVTNTMTWRI